MKEETIEEASEKYIEMSAYMNLTSKDYINFGVNWQKEQDEQALQTAINLLKQTTKYDVLDSWKKKVKELEKLL